MDLPPTTPNSCPGDAPTSFTVAADPGPSGLTKFTFDWRQTGAATYILEIRRREQNGAILVGFNTLTPRENGTLPTRNFTPGVYHFRLRGNCPNSLWSAEVVKGGTGGPNVPRPPVVPPPPPPPPVCIETCS